MKDRRTRAWGWALGLSVVLALLMGVTIAGKPASATGWIVYQVTAPASEKGLHIMRPDGSDQDSLDLVGSVSRQRHNGTLWGITRREVGDHVHPDGAAHEELFVRTEGDTDDDAIQLTNDTSIELSRYRWYNINWGHDDEFISWVGVRWGTDSNGDPYVVEAGIYRAEIAYDSSGNIVGLAETPWLAAEVGTYEVTWSGETYTVTEVRYGHDWSPDGEQVVWQYATSDSSPGYLHITDISDPTDNWRLTNTQSARRGVWSCQNEIAWKGTGGIRLIQPDGTGETLLWEPKNVTVSHLHWSHDGEFLTFQADGNRVRIYTLPVDKPNPSGMNIRGYPVAWVPE